MNKIRSIALFLSLLPILLFGQREDAISFRQIEENMATQMEVYPQEKIHLQTDRDFYVPGEKIWFKAYVTDAATLRYPTYSRYVYAELIDSRDSLVSRVMIRPIDDMFYGHIILSELIPQGNYTLRAYTKYMENMGDDYFFKKNIRIGNLPSDNQPFSKAKQENIKEKKVKDDFEVSFFPEGGNLPEGVPCKVAFKALNRNGYPEMISGEVVDATGAEIASVKTIHAGMGMFVYTPEQGKRYYLKCRNGNGLEQQFELPLLNPQAHALTAEWNNNELLIGVQKSIYCPDIPCYLLAHCRGLTLYFSAWNKKKEFIRFAKEPLPEGVIHFILFDEQMNPLSERLVYNKNHNEVKLEFHTHKASYERRENIISTLFLTDLDGNPLTGNLSVAITDDKDLPVDSSTTILSSLLLSSELKGYIENAAYYLQDNDHSTTALDYLMMTHGWRRYNIPEVVKGNSEYPQIPFQENWEISGKVKTLFLSKPVSDSDISIMVKNGDFGTAITDDQGRFVFPDLEYPDNTSYFIQALSKKGSSRVELDLDRESFPGLIYARQSPATEISAIKEEMQDKSFIMKAEQHSKYDEGMRMVYLNEVVVTASRAEREDEPRLRFPVNAASDKTIRREDFEKRHPTSVANILLTVAGVQMEPGGGISIRGGAATGGTKGIGGEHGGGIETGGPLILVDGVPWFVPLEMIHVNDVESIDVFKGASTALFGMHGANGVISITTRTAGGDKYINEGFFFNYVTYTPLGYQEPVEFYAPRYETLEAKQSGAPDYRTTVFWKPDVVISDTGEASFDFYASDFPTTYSVVLEGLTTDGRIIRQVEKISIDNAP